MKYSFLFILMTGLLLASNLNSDENLSMARKITKDFGSQLKGELVKGMKAGGEVAAIEVCYSKAPQIAEQISDSTGWNVGRTSLKIRNENNAPDEFEIETLKNFEMQKSNGINISNLEIADTVEINGDQYFRYMKAIPTGSICLNCHGSKIKEPLKENISELYENDAAVDYKMGEIRGAFTLSKKLN